MPVHVRMRVAHIMRVVGNRMIVSKRVIVIRDRVGVRHVMIVVTDRMRMRNTVLVRIPAEGQSVGAGSDVCRCANTARGTYEWS